MASTGRAGLKVGKLASYSNNVITTKLPQAIKHKLNERKRLLKSNRRATKNAKIDAIKHLNKEIKTLNGKINLDWLNYSFPTFIIKCKKLFL